ncbi:MAG: DNA ligase D [Candidatus Andersenbacteria bacterium]
MALAEYQRKRRFAGRAATPEPRGVAHAARVSQSGSSSQNRFVIHKHAARALHYDVRLEFRGVMWSWAVPKGPSDNPHDRHLAQRVEDHPLEYRHFEGVIPSGYGAGTVLVWDRGTFEWVKRAPDHVTVIFSGSKLRGEYALVRLRRAGPKSWLMIKANDRAARLKARGRSLLVNRAPNSVVTGRSLEQVRTGAPARASAIATLPGVRRAALPRTIDVMKATLVAKPFTDPEWLFETKWDGFRGIATIDGKRLTLVSRNNLDLLDRFPGLRDLPTGVAARRAVLDGEVVRLDSRGVSRFVLMKGEGAATPPGTETLYETFDLLHLDGYDLTHVPLEERKAMLRAIVKPHAHLKYTDHVELAGEEFFAETKRRGLEGMVAKERSSTYEQGQRTRTWLKIKHSLEQEFVVGGWQEGSGARGGTIGSLLLGYYSRGALHYAGRVGSGFAEASLREALGKLKRLERRGSPFTAGPSVPRAGQTHFVQPRLVAEVTFEEWTPDAQLRQPVFLGLRPDKSAREVVRERPRELQVVAAVAGAERPGLVAGDPASRGPLPRGRVPDIPKGKHVTLNEPLAFAGDADQAVKVGASTVAFSNLRKPFWRSPKVSKQDVLEYYYQVAPVLLPYLKDRPLTLKRYPNGAVGANGTTGEYFYQKNVPTPHPKFVATTVVQHHEGPTRYILCNNVETLLWAANLADLEIHPWYSRVGGRGSLDHPDFVVFALDPTDDRDLDGVRQVALVLKEVLDEFGLVGFPKSSGSRGIHVYVPIAPRATYDDTKFFAKAVTQLIHQLAPNQTTLEFYKRKRHGVYVDYLQNIKGKTLANAYSLRARPGAPVSTPLTWAEVKRGFRMEQFNIKSVLPRIKKLGDLWAPTLKLHQNLAPALKKLRALEL